MSGNNFRYIFPQHWTLSSN